MHMTHNPCPGRRPLLHVLRRHALVLVIKLVSDRLLGLVDDLFRRPLLQGRRDRRRCRRRLDRACRRRRCHRGGHHTRQGRHLTARGQAVRAARRSAGRDAAAGGEELHAVG